MSELPEGWVEARLEELGSWFGGGTPSKSKSEYWDNGTIPWVSPKDMKRPLIDSAEDSITELAVEQSSTKLIPKDSVLMVVRSGILAHTFPVATSTVPVTLNQDMKALHPSAIGVSFLAHGLRAFGPRILDECTKQGTTVASVNTDSLQGFNFPLPPLNEQKRIVAKIDALTEKSREAREALDEVPDLLDKLRQSILAAAFRGDLTKKWREQNPNTEPASVLLERIRQERRKKWEEAELAKFKAKGKIPKDEKWKAKYKEPEAVDTEGLPELPEGWCWASVEELTSFVTSGSRGWAQFYSQTGPLFVRSEDINRDVLQITNAAHVQPPSGGEGTRTRVERGDLLLTVTGANVTRTAGVLSDLGEAYVSQHVALVRLVDPQMLPILHQYLLSESGGRGHLKNLAYGGGKPGLNLEQIRTTPVPLVPFDEAEALLALLQRSQDGINAASTEAVSSNLDLSQLDASILAKAFRGELVPQDPNDEPASVLLERIRAEREQAGGGKKKRVPKKAPRK